MKQIGTKNLISPSATYFLSGQKVGKKALREFKLVRLLPDSNINSRIKNIANDISDY